MLTFKGYRGRSGLIESVTVGGWPVGASMAEDSVGVGLANGEEVERRGGGGRAREGIDQSQKEAE